MKRGPNEKRASKRILFTEGQNCSNELRNNESLPIELWVCVCVGALNTQVD
jgi:hypothetical protein